MTDTSTPHLSESGDPELVSAAGDSTLVQKLSAEALGTAVLVLFGCGAAVFGFHFANQVQQGATPATVTTVALAFGFTIVLLVYAFGRISGGHFNPAVSVGAAISGRMAWIEAAYYIGAQIVGGIVGAIVLWIVTKGFKGFKSTDSGLGANSFGGDGGVAWWAAFILEAVLTFLFVFVILSVTDERNGEFTTLAPFAIGLTLAVIHFVAIPVTGTSVNPARSIGPALFSGSGALKDLWLFIVAPLLGGALGGLAQPALFGRASAPIPGSGLSFASKPAAPAWGGAPDQFQQQWNQPADQQDQQQGWQQQAGWQQSAQQPTQQPTEQQGWGQHTQQAAPAGEPAPEGPAEQTQIKGGQSWQQPAAPAAEGELPVYEQDGWRWDYGKQQWVPIEGGDQPSAQG